MRSRDIREELKVQDLVKSNQKPCGTNQMKNGQNRTFLKALMDVKNLTLFNVFLRSHIVLYLEIGLDDLSCMQCVNLLKQIAQGGRTIICSIHTPSAKMFSVFDKVYIMSMGQCIYQGYGPEVISYLRANNLECPQNFNPADFNRLVAAIDNGKSLYSSKPKSEQKTLDASESTPHNNELQILEQDKAAQPQNTRTTWRNQFSILLIRMWKQMLRDKSYLLLRTILHILIGFIVGTLYIGMGKDGSKTIFNFGFYFTSIIFFMYIPMMPVLLQFPKEYQLIKREHFNKWYRLRSLYIILVYVLTDQPMEIGRLATFYAICMLTGIISESFGLLIASQLSLVNAMFMGPVLSVPFMLLAVYGFGSGYESIPKLIKFAMYFSYLRYSLEGLIYTMLTNREKLECPEEVEFCIWTDLDYFMKDMGMENTILWLDITALIVIYILFRGGFYYLLKQRLAPNKTFLAIKYIGRLIKSQIAR
ncbi:hypothetical protein YQE_02234, partial [Dendroctonus ponderosae]